MVQFFCRNICYIAFLSFCLLLAGCEKKIYQTDGFIIMKPAWVDSSDDTYKFTGIGKADNVGNIEDILQHAQNNAVNAVYYSIFKTTFDVVDDCLKEKNDDEVRSYKQQFIGIINGFDKDFNLEKNVFTINNWVNPDDGKMYVKVAIDAKKVIKRIFDLTDIEIQAYKMDEKKRSYVEFLQAVKEGINKINDKREDI